ncbi:MAG: 30S ribosomal protein S20 [Polyangiaceae bacterium]|nr:30S ribosomal protein S20 [Polyangiaceae bacterium]MBK8994342.1 30S ribosomal protein S20 [Myxococcales bacterium]MCL4754547.1 30S ribosomal protein S20 [Myxococcales bacterium]
MANHPSAQKRNRQRVVRTERNRAAKSTVRSAVKKARAAIASGDKAAAKASVASASTALAKAAKKGVLHKNSASRVTSRIQTALGKLG